MLRDQSKPMPAFERALLGGLESLVALVDRVMAAHPVSKIKRRKKPQSVPLCKTVESRVEYQAEIR